MSHADDLADLVSHPSRTHSLAVVPGTFVFVADHDCAACQWQSSCVAGALALDPSAQARVFVALTRTSITVPAVGAASFYASRGPPAMSFS